MTYWYPGVQETIKTARLVHPDVPVVLGGIYAKLCRTHAEKNSGADIISDSSNIEEIISILKGIGIYPSREVGGCIYPAMDLIKNPGYAVIMSSTGCPFDCRYCASSFLQHSYKRRNPQEVVKEILHWHNSLGITDFAFYDDALLINSAQHAIPIFEGILSHGLNIRLHTPNAVHAREISFDLARIMKQAGMKTIRLGLETADHDRREIDKKINTEEFLAAACVLHEAGFSGEELGAYILAGLPGQTPESVEATLKICEKAEIQPFLAEYSPIPHTALWGNAVKASDYDIENEPLFHNNTLLPCWNDKQRCRMSELKDLAVSIRRKIKHGP